MSYHQLIEIKALLYVVLRRRWKSTRHKIGKKRERDNFTQICWFNELHINYRMNTECIYSSFIVFKDQYPFLDKAIWQLQPTTRL